jgi:tetratricopeptide (TPR) repeat protein
MWLASLKQQFQQPFQQHLGASWFERWFNNYTASWMVFFKRYTPALARYEHSLSLHAKDETAKQCLANLYAQTESTFYNPQRALRLFTELITEHPNNANHVFNAAFLVQQQAQHREACTLFEAALAIDPYLDRAWYGLALSRMAQSHWAAAQTALEHNTRLQPMSPYGWYQLAISQAQLGLWDEAKKTGQHLMGFEPKFARGLQADLNALKQGLNHA